ncbi:hypothetical protein D3C80_2219700 [compost metagenome]
MTALYQSGDWPRNEWATVPARERDMNLYPYDSAVAQSAPSGRIAQAVQSRFWHKCGLWGAL